MLQKHTEKILFVHGKRSVSIIGEGDNKKIFVDGNEYKEQVIDGEAVQMSAEEVEELAHKIKRRKYNEVFKKQFKNFLVLSGAGTSIGVGSGDCVGLSMAQLWDYAEKEVIKQGFKKLCDDVGHNYKVKDLEGLISLIDGHILYSTDAKNRDRLTKSRDELLKMIVSKCTINAPEDDSKFPHLQFLSKITKRKPTLPRVKLFTLNYDLLFEQAANKSGAIVIDGFSFTYPRVFSGRYFDYDIVQREKSRIKDEDNFISRLFHLYKLHGSINWNSVEESDGGKNIVMQDAPKNRVMIYPRRSKYESSYEQPFFEMMARLQQNIRKDNCLLLCIGYSFNDKHINAAITEGLNQNPGFQLAVVNPDIDTEGGNNKFLRLIEQSQKSDSIIMIDERFDDFTEYFPEIQTYNNDNDSNKVVIDQ